VVALNHETADTRMPCHQRERKVETNEMASTCRCTCRWR